MDNMRMSKLMYIIKEMQENWIQGDFVFRILEMDINSYSYYVYVIVSHFLSLIKPVYFLQNNDNNRYNEKLYQ